MIPNILEFLFAVFNFVVILLLAYNLYKDTKLSNYWYISAIIGAILISIDYIIEGRLTCIVFIYQFGYFTRTWFKDKIMAKRLYIKLKKQFSKLKSIKIKVGA
jgi:hypothetical protein